MKKLRSHALVIGSGPGGQITSHRLIAAGFDVIMIERGPRRDEVGSPRRHSWAEICQMFYGGGAVPAVGFWPVTVAEPFCVGGGGEVNSGLYWRLPENIRSKWEAELLLPDFSTAAITSFYSEIEKHILFSENTQKRISQKLSVGAAALNFNYTPAQKIDSVSWNQPTVLLSQSTVKTFGYKKNCVSSALVFTPDGPVSVEFDHLFLCAGATGTPRILKKTKWNNRAGKNIQFHAMAKVTAEFNEPVNDLSLFVESGQARSSELVGSILSCSLSSAGFLAASLSENNKFVSRQDLHNFAIYNVNTSVLGTLSINNFGASTLISKLKREDLKKINQGVESLKKCLSKAGAVNLYVTPEDSLSRITALHLFGACALAGDVVAEYGQLRTVPNVRINDASMIPGCTMVNPQGTLMALAWRNMDHFLSELS